MKIIETKYGKALVIRTHTKKSMVHTSYLFNADNMGYSPNNFKVNPITGMAYLENPNWEGETLPIDKNRLPDPHDAWSVKHKANSPSFGCRFSHPKENI